MKKVMLLLAFVAMLGLVTAADAATINYMVKINGADLTVVTTAEVTVGVAFSVEIYANCPDVDFGMTPPMYGGVLQYSVDIDDSAGGLEPEDLTGGPPPFFPPDTLWDSVSTAPMTNYGGVVNSQGMDVLGQTGAIAPSAFAANYATFGAGPGVYSLVGSGNFTWDGSVTTLSLLPGEDAAQLVYGLSGAEPPTVTNGDSVDFVPEPATMSLLVLGGIAALIRRRK